MNEERDYSLHVKAGLENVGVNDEGDVEWLGSDKQWNDYQRMADAEPDGAKDEALNDTHE